MSKYPLIVNQLVSAAIDQGMSVLSKVYAVGDGGNGLCSQLEEQFENLQFILDRCHLKQHMKPLKLWEWMLRKTEVGK